MFTGIVEETGHVTLLEQVNGGWALTIQAPNVIEGLRLGASMAVNGVCLTITHLNHEGFTVGLAPETLRRSNLGSLKTGDRVNLERSVPANGRLDGHFVQGHIDGTGVIRQLDSEGDSLWVTVVAEPALLRYIVPKGCIAVDGVSLTVVEVRPEAFTFMLIPYSQQHTVLPHRAVGDTVNLEVDILGKYVEKFLGGGHHAVIAH